MSKFVIQGGKKLNGKIEVAANKNAVLPIMAAAVLTEKEVILENTPFINDVSVMKEILIDLGAKVKKEKRELIINASGINKIKINPYLSERLRASVLFIGPMLARFNKVILRHPGGDIIGKRGIQTHLEGFKSLGAKVEINDLFYSISMKKKRGGTIFLTDKSVTGTENLMMYASLIEEEVIIENAAGEPHIVDLAGFLGKLGVSISGAGTDRIRISGRRQLSGAQHKIGPDYIETGTFAIASALTGGHLEITNFVENDLKMINIVLERFGIKVVIKNNILKTSSGSLHAAKLPIKAFPWPGFPTDLMSPAIVLATQVKGQTLIHDPLYESRMFFVDKLISMGAKITICDPHRVIVYGPTQLYARHLASPDIRAGMALVIAALLAKGESIIDHAEIIERGYENLEKRLSGVGASIKKI